MPERPRVLHMGPDPAIGGGMAAALRALLESPLADGYELEVVPTYRGTDPLARLTVYLAALARLALWSLRGRGRIVHVHATVRGSTYRKAVCVLLAKALRRRVVLQIHSGAGDIAAFRASLDGLRRRLFATAFGAADVVVAVSDASAAALRQAYGLADVGVVPNAAPSVAPFERPAAGPAGPEALYLGGFANPAKGGDVMLAALDVALAAEPGLRVTLAGPGELPAAGAELVARHPGLAWAGWLEPARKDELMRRAEILLLPSRSEGLPMALLEGMAYAMAVLATAVGGIPETIEDGVEGVLVAPEAPGPLADKLLRLAADGELRQGLAAAARARAKSLDATAVAGRLAAIYARLG